MKPQVKKILQKFSTQKVDLSLINELRKLQKEIDSALNEEIKLRTEATKLNSKSKELDKRYNKLVIEAKAKANQFSKKSKELGIDEPAFLDSIYDSLVVNIYDNIKNEFK